MKTVRTVAALRAELARPRREGRSIGLVPTMGALHDGHLSLVHRAREHCELVVVSLFVNPSQFNDAGDLDLYPSDEGRDVALAAEAGVDFMFAPAVDEVYPPGFSTSLSVTGVSAGLEGLHRGPEHFDSVATVVAKLFNMVGPDVAYFGQKDAQQAVVVQRMVSDLNLPVRIAVCPTVRAADGLALSSRNARLSPTERRRAAAIPRALQAVKAAIVAGERDPAAALAAGAAELHAAGIEAEYLELVAADTMTPVQRLGEGHVLAVVAAPVGDVRLIDNTPIHVLSTAPSGRALGLQARLDAGRPGHRAATAGSATPGRP